MSTEADLLTVEARLAASRRALVRQFDGGSSTRRRRSGLRLATPVENEAPGISEGAARFGWMSIGQNVVRRWWRRHPANAVGQLAMPLLERYARDEPAKLLAAAAATGSLVVLVKPWRLLSITAVLAAVLKTSDVADLVTTLMQKNANPRKELP